MIIRLFSEVLSVILMLKVVMFRFEVMLVVWGVKCCVCLIMYICSFGMLLKVIVFSVSMVSSIS